MRKLLLFSLILNLLGICLGTFIVLKLGGVSNIVYKLKAKHAISKMDHRNSQFTSSPTNEGAIIFLGDSITEYGEWSELFPNDNILNRGIAGDGILGTQQRLNEIKRHQPNKVFLMIGINDLLYHNAEYVTNIYIGLLKEIGKQLVNTELLVQSILPINNSIYKLNTSNKEIDNVNASIKKYCIENGIKYIDIASSLKNKENNLNMEFTSDGIHINGIAYNVWKEKLSNWLPTI